MVLINPALPHPSANLPLQFKISCFCIIGTMSTNQCLSASDWIDFYRFEVRNALQTMPSNTDQRKPLRTRLKLVAEREINRTVEETKESKTYGFTILEGKLKGEQEPLYLFLMLPSVLSNLC